MANIAKSFFDIPETAIAAYEHWSGLQVGVHDLDRRLILYVPPTRPLHRNPFCDILKTAGYNPECYRFEVDCLRPWLLTCPEGCIKRCHAGIVELSVPIMSGDRLAVVLFAGLCHAAPDVAIDLVDPRTSRAHELWPEHMPPPVLLDAERAQLCLEGLRQLAARLSVWLDQLADTEDAESVPGSDSRRLAIHRFIHRRFSDPVGLAELAEQLSLSRSRTAHLVREVCGQPFVQLLTSVRLRHAASLLRQTRFPVSEVARQSGFSDVSNFHKAFKRCFDLSPLRYRQRNGGVC